MVLPLHIPCVYLSSLQLLWRDKFGAVLVFGIRPGLEREEVGGEFGVVACVREPGEGDEVEMTAFGDCGCGVRSAGLGVLWGVQKGGEEGK